MGELVFTRFNEIASKERLNEWFAYQSSKQKPLYYILPSVKWFSSARKEQPGIPFQTFDELALLLLKTAKVEYIAISEEERELFFYDMLSRTENHLSEKEFSQKAQAYAGSYGQLKRLGLKVEETPEPLANLKEAFWIYEQEYRDQQGLFDQENRILKAVETTIQDFPLSHVVIDGYMDFSPVQYQFIEYLIKASVPCTIYLPALDTAMIHETVSTLRKLGIHISQDSLPALEVVCQKTSVTAATTIEEEIHGVLETIAAIRGTGHYSQFGIVLANEKAYLSDLEQISAQKLIPLNRASKKRLEETNFLSFLQQVLEKQDWRSKWDKIHLVDTLSKLCFLSPPEFNEVKELFIRIGEFSRADLGALLELVLQFQAGLPEEDTFASYLKHLHGFLEELPLSTAWKDIIHLKDQSTLTNAAVEMRTYHHVKKIVADMIESQSPIEISLPLQTFKRKLLKKLNEESLYMDRKPTDGIELYSFRDVPLFKGKHLFVLGLNEGEFPKQTSLKGYFQERYVKKLTSLFPLPLSDYFRKKDDASFAQLNYIAENLYFSFVEGMNPHQPLLPSKYLMEMTNSSPSYSTVSRLASESYLTEDEYEEKLAYQVGNGKELSEWPPLLKEYRKNLDHLQTGEELISSKWEEKLSRERINITRLESYASCSFKYGLEKLLMVQDPLQKQLKVDPLETGNMLHRLIEKFYQSAQGIPFSDLLSFFQSKDEEILADLFENEWEIVQQKHPEISMLVLMKEKEEWWKKVRRWLAAERFRFWENEQLANMSIFKLEEAVTFTLELSNQKVLTLTGKIDRVDLDEHGFVIYDYKSSDKELDFQHKVPQGILLQIPLYMMALSHEFKQGKYEKYTNKEAIGGGYISIKTPHHRKKNMVWKNDEHKQRFAAERVKTNIISLDSESLIQEFKIPELIERLWRGTFTDFSVRPYSAEACTYCSYKSICRVTKEQQDF